MYDLPETLTVKENILSRCFASFFFGLAAAVLAVASALKLGDGPIWIILFVASASLAFILFYYILVSIRYRQVIEITSTALTSRSMALGTVQIPWYEILDIREIHNRFEQVRSAAPLIEVMLSLYLNLPFLVGIERRGTLLFEAENNRQIAVRQHLLYPHRLDQLRHAIERYAPPPRRPNAPFLNLNMN
jgi:hypothetical protein